MDEDEVKQFVEANKGRKVRIGEGYRAHAVRYSYEHYIGSYGVVDKADYGLMTGNWFVRVKVNRYDGCGYTMDNFLLALTEFELVPDKTEPLPLPG